MEVGPKTNGVYVKHGYSHTRVDHIYKSMIDRCENPRNYGYYKYGGRGIHVCEEWKTNKKAFFEWAFANGYAENLTIDRKDNSKGYSPENCRWITYQEQNNNRRSNRYETIDGETHTVAEWSRISGIKQGTIQYRLAKGWNPKDAVFKPLIPPSESAKMAKKKGA